MGARFHDSGLRVWMTADARLLSRRDLRLLTGDAVTLITADTAMRLRAQAYEIPVIRPPEECARTPPASGTDEPVAQA